MDETSGSGVTGRNIRLPQWQIEYKSERGLLLDVTGVRRPSFVAAEVVDLADVLTRTIIALP